MDWLYLPEIKWAHTNVAQSFLIERGPSPHEVVVAHGKGRMRHLC